MEFRERKLFSIKNASMLLFLLLCGIWLTAGEVYAAVYVKVDGSVSASGDGLTWATAKKTIQEAMGVYSPEEIEIWVKAGTYTPSSSYAQAVVDMKRQKLYGGFAGTEVTGEDRDRRNWRANRTVLDAQGVYCCIKYNNFGDVTIDGFTMTGASNKAVWAFCSANTLTISNCVFRDNDFIAGNGSAVGITQCSGHYTRVVLYNNIFDNNKGTWASAVNIDHSYISYCYLYVINCTMVNNTAVGHDYGGGTRRAGATIYNDGDSGYGYAYIYNSIFWNNSYITDRTVDNFYTYRNYGSLIEGTGAGSPELVDPDNGDFHLMPGSPCIDSGTDDLAYIPQPILDSLPDRDFEGDARVIGYGPDMGADEFNYDGDGDFDGIPDDEESGPEGDDPGYDGNGDGVPDSDQDNSTSFNAFGDQGYLTLATPEGTVIRGLMPTGNPSPADSPESIDFPLGFLNFSITGLNPGEAVTASLFFTEDTFPTTYWQYGPTPDNALPHWYEFLYDGQTGAEILENEIILHFVDGLRGDHDLAADGKIKDPGGPGITYAVEGDINGDGQVDRDDVYEVLNSRNQPAEACPECDIDGDGVITVLDARKLILLCTCPYCLCNES